MTILLSNDDGVNARGLRVLAQALAQIADIEVVAPDRDRSAASNSLTLSNPIRLKQLENGFYSVQGTPTDCIHLAVTGLLKERPRLVIAGINEGANLGDDVFYSGTVAAAIEAGLMGIPAIAISLVNSTSNFTHFDTAAFAAKQLIQHLEDDFSHYGTILNINVPDIPINKFRGFKVTRLGRRHHAEPIIKSKDPRGHEIYWVGPPGPESDAGVGTDFHAISEGYAAMTPILLDLTYYQAFERLTGWVNGFK